MIQGFSRPLPHLPTADGTAAQKSGFAPRSGATADKWLNTGNLGRLRLISNASPAFKVDEQSTFFTSRKGHRYVNFVGAPRGLDLV